MKTFLSMLTLAAAGCFASNADAQVVTYYRPVLAPRTVYYAPAPAPVVVQRPVVVHRPVVVEPAPVQAVTYYSPVVEPVVAPVVYEPAVRVRQRYRPILGGTVTRVHHGYVPSVYPIVRY